MSRNAAQEYGAALQASQEFHEPMEVPHPYDVYDVPGTMQSSRPASAPSGCCSAGANGMTVHEASRAKKAVEANVKAIENRIRFFQREEEKIWRDLEEVRRQAATIEEGRTRTLEKKLADRTIQQERELLLNQNRERATATKSFSTEERKRRQMLADRDKKLAGEEQRRVSQDILRQKRMQEAQARLQNSERAVAIQRSQLESRLRVNQERASRIERLREQHEAERLAAEAEVADAEARLPQLEAEEIVCLQRLQNSRIVTQSVLEELESSLGKQSAVTSLLRSKQRGQEHLNSCSVGSSNVALHADAVLRSAVICCRDEFAAPASPEQLSFSNGLGER